MPPWCMQNYKTGNCELSYRQMRLWDLSLTQWGQVTHICVSKLTIIGSDNGLSPGRRQAIIWTNAGILLIGPLGTNCSEILIAIETISFKQKHLKMSFGKWRTFYLGLNVLRCVPDGYLILHKVPAILIDHTQPPVVDVWWRHGMDYTRCRWLETPYVSCDTTALPSW